jgi:Ca2+-binding RTX toxin-like protein
MSVSNELLLSILAMDAYNRGYDPGILLDANASGIGTATIRADSTSVLGFDVTSGAGFYALSYTWNGQTVISYRGTDNIDAFAYGDGASDLWRGWITGAGALVPGGQAQLAVDFYNYVTGANVMAGASGGGAILTGHSLGGGLAGFIGSFTHDQTLIFDNMPYVVAATGVEFFSSVLDVDTSNIRDIFVYGEALQFARGLQFLAGGILDPLLAPIILPLAYNNLAGETQTYVSANAGLSDPTILHHQALVPILLFAVDEARAHETFTGWQSIGKELLNAIYNEDVALAAGFLRADDTATATAEKKMAMALAYSAIDEGTLVFGNTGIRAMFDDANQIGGVIRSGHATAPLQGAMAGLVEAFVQYAGMLAFNKVDSTGQNSVNPLQGVISLLKAGAEEEDATKADTLLVDLSEARWNMTGNANAQLPEIVGLDTIFTGVLVPGGGVLAADNPYLITFRSLYANGSTDPKAGLPSQVLERIEFSLSDSGVTYTMSEPGMDPLGVGDGTGARHVWMYVGGAGDDQITGNSNDNVLAGGGGADTIDGGMGKDILVGGDGEDTLKGGLGDDIIIGGADADTIEGGEGFDIASYAGSSGGVKIDLTLETQQGGDAEGDTYKDIEGVRGSEKDDELIGDYGFNILIGGGGNDTLISQRTAANLDENGHYLKDDDGKTIYVGTFDILIGGSGYDTYEINSNIYWGLRKLWVGDIAEQIYQPVSAIVEDSDGQGVLSYNGSRMTGAGSESVRKVSHALHNFLSMFLIEASFRNARAFRVRFS